LRPLLLVGVFPLPATALDSVALLCTEACGACVNEVACFPFKRFRCGSVVSILLSVSFGVFAIDSTTLDLAASTLVAPAFLLVCFFAVSMALAARSAAPVFAILSVSFGVSLLATNFTMLDFASSTVAATALKCRLVRLFDVSATVTAVARVSTALSFAWSALVANDCVPFPFNASGPAAAAADTFNCCVFLTTPLLSFGCFIVSFALCCVLSAESFPL
jgi:hypothetical protein